MLVCAIGSGAPKKEEGVSLLASLLLVIVAYHSCCRVSRCSRCRPMDSRRVVVLLGMVVYVLASVSVFFPV